MNAFTMLHHFIEKNCPHIHRKRCDTLMLAVQSLSVHGKASLTGLGRTLLSPVWTKHNIKRMDRLFGNSHLHDERKTIYQATISLLTRKQKNPVILVDWSQVNKENGFHILRASLACEGRALTLYEEVYPAKYSHNPVVHQHFLNTLKSLFSEKVTPIIVADAGFKNPWFKAVAALDWYWVGRIRHFTQFCTENVKQWRQCRSLNEIATSKPKALGEIILAKRNPLLCHGYLYKKPLKGRKKLTQGKRPSKRTTSSMYGRKEREPWFLVTNLPGAKVDAKGVVKIYRARMQIEESFRDNKNQRIGLSLRESRSKSAERLQTLLLIVMLATLALWLIGHLAIKLGLHVRYQANTVKNKPVLSMFNLGMQVLRKEKMLPLKRSMFMDIFKGIPHVIT